MNLSIGFVSTIMNTFGADGERFITDLPSLVEEASQQWGLTNIQPVLNLSYNFVAFAESSKLTAKNAKIAKEKKELKLHVLRELGGSKGQSEVVLKIGVPRDELTSEIAALRLFDGEGACQLIDCDEEKGFLLLERLKPGVMLSTLEDDDEATRIAAGVMKRVWRAGFDTPSANASGYSTSDSKFIFLSDWFDELEKLRPMFNGGTGPFDENILGRVERSVKDLFAENHQPVLMHGDFHHFNILSSERGWLVIDPKGVIGPACYELGPLMMNPWGRVSRQMVEKRVDILHEQLGFERERIMEWSLAHAILSAWWDYPNLNWGYSMRFAEMIANIK